MLADEVPCAGCDQLTDLVPAPETWPQLKAELEGDAEASGEERAFSPVVAERFELPDGGSTPLSAFFTQVRRRKAERGLDLGSLLAVSVAHRIAYRLRVATDLRRQAVAKDPTAIEAFWGLATLLVDQDLPAPPSGCSARPSSTSRAGASPSPPPKPPRPTSAASSPSSTTSCARSSTPPTPPRRQARSPRNARRWEETRLVLVGRG